MIQLTILDYIKIIIKALSPFILIAVIILTINVLLFLQELGLIWQPGTPTKIIEYSEEVKLHDNSMMWVDISRHYERVSADISGGRKKKQSMNKRIQ